ncbi:SpoIIE family protein phosphatase [Streptomyces tropicalis]|uniref:SpoIIE family protein phosphatase n=1 Tax=Streptomyces tropicalis TaxID=3034234 RepID=A0ABT5ZYP3_9ACTN|nr:SpoIIE family protein phosphatase [Streptomyces tropicalis]MDF3297511.1 SpoIIE family protein phosphatase [Streptomyces tropicalis]
MPDETPGRQWRADESARPIPREADLAILDALFTQSPMGVAVFDTQLRLVRANPALERMHGVPNAELLGHRLSEVLPALDAAGIESRLARVLETGLSVVGTEHRGRTPADPSRDHVWLTSSFALTGQDGRRLGVTDLIMDVTDRHRARERLALLDEASTRIGTTLDVTRTAQELADVLVPRLADLTSIDLLDGVVRGEQAPPSGAGDKTLRLVARKASHPGFTDGLQLVGGVQEFAPDSPHAQTLCDGQPRLLPAVGPDVDWVRNSLDPRTQAMLTYGTHSMMVVPLRARDTVLGLAHLYRTAARPDAFEPDDLVFVQELVARAAVCVDNARRYTSERATAVTLQQSMLPRSVPDQSAVEVAHQYRPALAHAGGSGCWFDVIPLSGARVALAVGDTPATGVEAVACIGQICSTVRTLAQLDLAPEEVLARLDDMVPRLVEREHTAGSAAILEKLVGATCLYAVYDPVSRRCVMASAGHPPPIVADPVGQVHFADLPSSEPLGLGDPVFEPHKTELAEGSTLVLYGQSFLAARNADQALQERLSALIAQSHLPPDDISQAVANAVAPHLAAEDDLALLLARTRSLDAEHVATWDLPCDPAAVASTRSLTARRLDQWGLGHLTFTTELIVSELVTNAIRYGAPPIRLRLILDRMLICEVSDGSGTSPHIRRAATVDEGGRGLFLVAECSHRWGTRYDAAGKTIWAEQPLTETPPRSVQP